MCSDYGIKSNKLNGNKLKFCIEWKDKEKVVSTVTNNNCGL